MARLLFCKLMYGFLLCCLIPRMALAQISPAQPAETLASQSLADLAEREDWSALAGRLATSPADKINAAQPDSMTALHWSVWHDNATITSELLTAGANPNAANRYGVVPAMIACTQGNAAILRSLLEHGADPRVKTDDGETLVMTAARSGSAACVDLLIKSGADVHARERKEQTALVWAAHEGHAKVVKLLIEAGADYRSSLASGFTPLLLAARQGQLQTAQVLIDAGCDVNEALQRKKGGGGKLARNGTSPLIMAVENGHFELAAMLLQRGADPNDQRSGFTALHTLTWVRKPNRGDGDDGDPAPIGSGKLTSLEFVKVLKAAGADVNARLVRGNTGPGQLNRQGATPLLLAAHTDDLPYVKLLVELGADPHLPNVDGCTALMAAAGIGVLAPGEEAGTEEEALETVEYLISQGLSVNTIDKHGETAMHGAAYKSLPRMVRLLSERGADIEKWNRANEYGWTPLAIAQGHRPGNFKPHAETENALLQLLK